MKQWYQKTAEETLRDLNVTADGLSGAKADELLKEHGENVLAEGKRKTALQVFLSQFADLLVIILIVAAVISIFSGNLESTIVIFAVIILNAILGTVQHIKAEKSLDSLKSLASPAAKVIRDGQKLEIDSRKVVPGDIIVLEAGDMRHGVFGQLGHLRQGAGGGHGNRDGHRDRQDRLAYERRKGEENSAAAEP